MASRRRPRSQRRAQSSSQTPKGAWLAAIEQWLALHRSIVVGIIVATAVLIRVLYFMQLNATPLMETQHWAQSDMHYYDAWAKRIAAGDWLSKSTSVPMHRWHDEIAQLYLTSHPDTKQGLEQEARTTGVEAKALLWSRWMHVPQFYQDPLYSYLVALTYRVTGADVRHVYAWQLALGALEDILIWLIARRCFGDLVAAIAAGLAVLCAPLLHYELLLLRDSSIVVAGLLLAYLTHRTFQSARPAMYGVLGFAAGLSCLLKSTFLLWAVGIIVAVVLERRAPRAIFAVAAGVILGLAPLAVRNVDVGVAPFSLASSGPLTFVSSNDANYPPDVGFGIQIPLLAAFLGDTDGGWREAARTVLASQSPATYTAMVWRKFDRAWHWYEIPNNENMYYTRRQAPVLAWLPVTFWLCAPLALVGLALATPRMRELWPLYLLVIVAAAPLVAFYVLGRFRIALIAATIPFAAFTIVEVVHRAATGRYTAAAVIVAASAGVMMWTGRPLADDQLLIRTADWISPYSAFYQMKVYEAGDAKHWAVAAAWYQEFFRKYEPSPTDIAASGNPTLAPELADMHRECAQLLQAAGDRVQANAQLVQADELLKLGPASRSPR
ncbi:MAG TPA: glycosyltransferase family 39 protein [Vicinamibacterales bacterium]|nr:glycosyltransferase family 39 protein [Vicinamibacterales bacterium]